MPEFDPAPCEATVQMGNYLDPPILCDRDAVEGEEFCEGHL